MLPIPTSWIAGGAVVLAVAAGWGWTAHELNVERAGRAADRLQAEQQRSALLLVANQAQQAARDTEARWSDQQKEALNAAQKATDAARADADAARTAAERLRQRAIAAAASGCAAAANPGAAAGSPSASTPADLLAELSGRLAEVAGQYADVAEDALIRGQACEASRPSSSTSSSAPISRSQNAQPFAGRDLTSKPGPFRQTAQVPSPVSPP